MSIVSVAEILRHTEKLKEDLLKAQQLVADYIIELKRDGAHVKSKDGTVTIVPYTEINSWFQTVRDKVIVINSYLTVSDIDAIESELRAVGIRYFELQLTRNTYIIHGGMLPDVGIMEDYTNFLCFAGVRYLYNGEYDLSHTNIVVSYAGVIDLYGATVSTLFVNMCEELYLVNVTVGYIYAYVVSACVMDVVSTIKSLGRYGWVVFHGMFRDMGYIFNDVLRINVFMIAVKDAVIYPTGVYEEELWVYSTVGCFMLNTVEAFRCDPTGTMCVRAGDVTVEPVTETQYKVSGPQIHL
jgi:hypothetical protein